MYSFFKLCIVVLVVSGLMVACTKESRQEMQLRQNINKELRMDIFPSVVSQQKVQAYDDFRREYKYISVVFLRKGCKPCDLKIAEWQERIEKIKELEDYSVLFIFQGYSYKEISQLDTTRSLNFICDIHCRYLIYNRDIPEWILDNTILIDARNRIKLVGDPFSTDEKTEQLYSIIKMD